MSVHSGTSRTSGSSLTSITPSLCRLRSRDIHISFLSSHPPLSLTGARMEWSSRFFYPPVNQDNYCCRAHLQPAITTLVQQLNYRNAITDGNWGKRNFYFFYLAMEKIFASGSFHHPVSSRRFGRLAPRIPRLGAVPGNDFERSLMMTILATGSFHHQQSSNAMPSAVGDFFLLLPPSGENLGHLKKRSRPTYRAKNRFQGR